MKVEEVIGGIQEAIKNRQRVLAVEQIKHALEQGTQLGRAWVAVGQMALSLGESQLAVDCADKLRQQVTETTIDSELQAAGILAEAGALPVAMTLMEQYLPRFPDNPSILHLCGTIAAQLHHQDKARQYLTKLVGLQPQLGISWLTLAAVVDFANEPELHQQLLQAKDHYQADQGLNFMHYHYAVGKALTDLGQYDEALQHYQHGAEVMAEKSRYKPDLDERMVVDIQRNYSGMSYKRVPRARIANEQTVAILGLPRSGTTLLGQMLAKHSAVNVASEHGEFGQSCRHIAAKDLANFPGYMHTHGDPQSAIDMIAETYQRLLMTRHGSDGLIVDKSLNLNRLFGIWAKAVPQGKAIYIQRSRQQVEWSCFKSAFRGGADWSWSKAFINSYLDHEEQLLDHWQQEFPERIHRLDYASLVSHPEDAMRGICEFLELSYEPEIITPKNSLNPVTTSSLGQVDSELSSTFSQLADEMSKRFRQS